MLFHQSMHKSPRFKMPAGSTVWNQSQSETHMHLGKLAVYIPIRNITPPIPPTFNPGELYIYHNTLSLKSSISRVTVKNFVFFICWLFDHQYSQKLNIALPCFSDLNSFLFRSIEFFRSCTFLKYFWLANMVIWPSVLALIILSNMPCATFQDKNLA